MNNEKKNNRTGLIVSLSIHAVLIILGLFVVSCWKAPGPPWPEAGLEIAFGEDFSGSGDNQIITENVTEAKENEEEQVEEQNSEVTEPIEDVVEEDVTPAVETTPVDPVETYTSEEPTQATESTTKASSSKLDPTPNPGTVYKPSSNSGGQGTTNNPGDEGSPDGTPTKNSGGGDNGLVKIGGWSVEKSPDFSGTIKQGAVMEIKIHINELGQVEQIIWVHSSLTPSEKKIIEQKFKSELRLSEIAGQKQEAVGSYKIKFE